MNETFEEPLKLWEPLKLYDPIEPYALDNKHGSEIHEKHFLLKLHFEYSKFVPLSHEVKDMSSLTSALAH